MIMFRVFLAALWRRFLGGALGDIPRTLKIILLAIMCIWMCWEFLALTPFVFGLLVAWFTIKHDNGGENYYWFWRYPVVGWGYCLKEWNIKTPWLGQTEWAELILGASSVYFMELFLRYYGHYLNDLLMLKIHSIM